MSPLILTAVIVLIPITLLAVVLCTRSIVARIGLALLCLAGGSFCGFGFLASFEPLDTPNWPWQLGYALLGLGMLSAAVLLTRSAVRAARSPSV